MKKIFFIVAIAAIFIGCSKDSSKNDENKRVKLLEEASVSTITYQIVQVDGKHEYLSRYQGGMVHLEECAYCCQKDSATKN